MVLVVGARGQLGRQVTCVLEQSGWEVAALGVDELDVLERHECDEALREHHPDAVIDCSLPAPQQGRPAIVAACRRGAGNLAAAAGEAGIYSIYVSCAEVFSGIGEAPYSETDAPDPETTLGRAKLAAERAVTMANPRSAIVRTAWLYGTGGTNFAEYLLEAGRLSEHVPVDLTLTSNPTYTGHLSDAIADLVQRPETGIFHLAAAGECTQFGFARALFRAARLRAEPTPILVGPLLPKRSRVLASSRPGLRPLPDWRAGIEAYVSAWGGAGLEVEDVAVNGETY